MDQWKSWLIDIENKRKLRKSQTVFMRQGKSVVLQQRFLNLTWESAISGI